MRLFSACTLLFLLCTCGRAPSPEAPATAAAPLRSLADYPIGTATSSFGLSRDSQLLRITLEEFNSITANNEMKMYTIAGKPGPLDFTRPDAIMAIAEENNLRMFGHTLLWHYGFPQYLEDLSPAAAEDFMLNYIDTVVTRYQGRIDGWDVVNEAFDTKGGALRDTPWLQKVGPSYIEKAFRRAHAADPAAKLFINDFNTERDTAKFHALLRLVKQFQADGVPIHGIGFQMHIRMDTDEETIAYTLEKAAATGLLIHLSEVDIIFNKHDDTNGGGEQIVDEITPELLEKQAEKYEFLVRTYEEKVPPAQRYGITFWGFNDRDTWINGFFKLRDWPTIMDKELQKKPAYYGVARALEMD